MGERLEFDFFFLEDGILPGGFVLMARYVMAIMP